MIRVLDLALFGPDVEPLPFLGPHHLIVLAVEDLVHHGRLGDEREYPKHVHDVFLLVGEQVDEPSQGGLGRAVAAPTTVQDRRIHAAGHDDDGGSLVAGFPGRRQVWQRLLDEVDHRKVVDVKDLSVLRHGNVSDGLDRQHRSNAADEMGHCAKICHRLLDRFFHD